LPPSVAEKAGTDELLASACAGPETSAAPAQAKAATATAVARNLEIIDYDFFGGAVVQAAPSTVPFLLLRLAPAAGFSKPWRRPLIKSVSGR